jgi:hypothetical protein
MLLARRRRQPLFETPEQLAEAAVSIAICVRSAVFLPEDMQSDARPLVGMPAGFTSESAYLLYRLHRLMSASSAPLSKQKVDSAKVVLTPSVDTRRDG